jgi:hypothetical protein
VGGGWSGVSERDLEVLEFVARFGVVPRAAAARWAATGRTMTLRREKRLREAGLLAVQRPWDASDPVLVASRQGLMACGREELSTARVSLATLHHFSVVAHLAAVLEGTGAQLLAERELRAHERALGKRQFSLTLPRGKHHRPDLVILPADPGSTLLEAEVHSSASDLGRQGPSSSRTQGGRRSERTAVRERADRTEDTEMRSVPGVSKPIAVEVELSEKSNARLDAIVGGWKAAVDAGRFEAAHYFCASKVRSHVERAVDRVGAQEHVRVELLPEEDLLAPSLLV